MTGEALEPITPAEAKAMYLNTRKGEVTQLTLDGYHYRLKHFIRWCENVEGIDNLNTLSGRDFQRFKTWRRDDGDFKPITLEGNLDALRVFLRWCGTIDAVGLDLQERLEVLMPSLDKEDEQSEVMLDPSDAEAILDYLRKFEWHPEPTPSLRSCGILRFALGLCTPSTGVTTIVMSNASNSPTSSPLPRV